MRKRFAMGMLAVALACGCLSATQRREDDLIKIARDFNDDLRWARWEAMAALMAADDRQNFMGRVDLAGKNLVMGDFEVRAIRFDSGSQGATVTVDLQWYRNDDPTVRSSTLVQRWETRGLSRWTMVKQRRARGDRFPLVNEPVEKQAPAVPTAGPVEKQAPAVPAAGPS